MVDGVCRPGCLVPEAERAPWHTFAFSTSTSVLATVTPVPRVVNASGPEEQDEARVTVPAAQKTQPDADRPSGPRSRKGTQTRARLLAAAKEVFEELGYFDARVSDIAARATLSQGSFYHYFDSKEQIFREVAAAVDDELSEPLGAVLDPSTAGTTDERLRRALRWTLERYRDEARMIGVISQVVRYDEHVSARRTDLHRRDAGRVSDSIRQMQLRGLADTRLDPAVAAHAIGGMVWRFAEAWLVEGFVDCDFDDAVEQLTVLITNALAGPGPEVPLS